MTRFNTNGPLQHEYHIFSNRGLGFNFLCENFDPASKQGRLLFEGGFYLAISVLVYLYFKIINFNCTYRHLASGQRVHNNLTMESVILGHHVSEVFYIVDASNWWLCPDPIINESLNESLNFISKTQIHNGAILYSAIQHSSIVCA